MPPCRLAEDDDDAMSTAEALSVIDQVAALAPEAMLILAGREPLLRADLEELVTAAARRGLPVVVGSNGMSLLPSRATSLRQAGVIGIGISLDSATPDFHDRLHGRPGAWGVAIVGSAAAYAAGLSVLLQATLFSDNRHEIVTIVALARDLGVSVLNFFFFVCTGRGVTQTNLSSADYEASLTAVLAVQAACPDMIIRARCAPYVRRLLGVKQGERRGSFADWSSACLAGRSYLRITPTGEVTPCPYMPLAVGSLRTMPLAEIWNNAQSLRRLREEMPSGKC